MSDTFCPSSFCPLIAPNGSPWTGAYKSKCPQHDDFESGGCPWWSMACESQAPHRGVVDEAEKHGGRSLVLGPMQPKDGFRERRTFDCKFAQECSWQVQAGEKLCPPRYALSKGLDPKICNF